MCLERNPAGFIGIFQRVVKQYGDQLCDRLFISAEIEHRLDLHGKGLILHLGKGLERLRRFCNHVGKREIDHLYLRLFLLHTGKINQILCQR